MLPIYLQSPKSQPGRWPRGQDNLQLFSSQPPATSAPGELTPCFHPCGTACTDRQIDTHTHTHAHTCASFLGLAAPPSQCLLSFLLDSLLMTLFSKDGQKQNKTTNKQKTKKHNQNKKNKQTKNPIGSNSHLSQFGRPQRSALSHPYL